MNSDVSVLGCGVMGSALVQALLKGGSRVTVWNRTAAKAELLVRRGARGAATPDDAVRASPIVIVCVTDYEQTLAALAGTELAGRTLVQLSTGSPKDARLAEAWALERGAEYLDGAILATPRQIGTPESAILVSGSQRAFEASHELLGSMAPTVSYLGDRVSAASAFDLAFITMLFGALAGFYHAITIVESERLPLSELSALLEASGPAMIQMMRHDASTVESGAFEQPEATLDICQRALALIERSARESGLDASVPSFLERLFAAGQIAGLGAESPAALVKLLRSRAPGHAPA
jgi:3-hydroxyisobutyrate dehydrogenase-like beta-hydroxyacid dehydrogenase